MKKGVIRLLSVILIASLVISTMPAKKSFATSSDDFRVVISVEGNTIGQGMYIEPRIYTEEQISELLAAGGYDSSYDRSNLTAALVTLAMFTELGIDCNYSGDPYGSFYLQSVEGIDKNTVDIPEIISNAYGVDNSNHSGNDDTALGEFDYNSQSGWMITVNDLMIPVGAGAFVMTNEEWDAYSDYQHYDNTYVIRWQFTLCGLGADLGYYTGWGDQALYEHNCKDKLYIAYANCKDDAAKAAALPVLETLNPTDEEINAALSVLESGSASSDSKDVNVVLSNVFASMVKNVPEPTFGTNAGEWTVLSLARGGYYPTGHKYFEDYYTRMSKKIADSVASTNLNGAIHKAKSTENSRAILALSAIGKDARNVNGVDLIGAYEKNGLSWITKQGLNGPIFALIALDTVKYNVSDSTLRQQCVDYILSKELATGGWTFSGSTLDPDMCSMALQALAPYRDQPNVSAAAERAFAALSKVQQANGGFSSWGSVNSESIAQVITALTAWGIDPLTDSRFVKNENTLIDSILSFYVNDPVYGYGFAHAADTNGKLSFNAMATDQATYALVAYERFKNKKNSLYDMTDVLGAPAAPAEIGVGLTVPENIENTKGTNFNALLNLTGWDTKADFKLMDCVITVPDKINVKDVTAGSRLKGGQVSYNLDKETGKLRIVYFDAQGKTPISFVGTTFPGEFLNINFEVTETLNPSELSSLKFEVSGMSFKKTANESSNDRMVIVNTEHASSSVTVVDGPSYSVTELFAGDDIDVIKSENIALAISVTKVAPEAKITYNDGNVTTELYYSPLLSKKLGVSTYVCMCGNTNIEGYRLAENYTVSKTEKTDSITFGDFNNDNQINAQDALASVNIWLRKIPVDEKQILTMNVNADSRLNTFDTLAIIEYFVDGVEFSVASAIK